MKRYPAVLLCLAQLVVMLSTPLAAVGYEDLYVYLADLSGQDDQAGQQAFYTLVIPPGGMYQAMGTAYSAVLADSGYLEANPAGSALLKETEVSVYHNDWIGESRLEAIIGTFRGDDWGAGAGLKLLYIPFTAVNTWGERYRNPWTTLYAKGYYTEFIGTLNGAYNLFRSFYWSGITVGANLKTAVRGVPDSIAQNQSAATLLGDVGAITQFNFLKAYTSRYNNTSLAFTVKNLGLPVGVSTPVDAAAMTVDMLPTAWVAGAAWKPTRWLTLSNDLTWPFVFNPLAVAGLGKAEKWSNAIGASFQLEFIGIQTGVELKEGRPRFSLGGTYNNDNLTINVNWTLDLLTAGLPDRISVQVKMNLGDLGRQDREDGARTRYLEGMAKYSEGKVEEAIILWQKSFDFVPNYQPALEMLRTAQDYENAKKTMDEVDPTRIKS